MSLANKPFAALNEIENSQYEIIIRDDAKDEAVDGVFAIIDDGDYNLLFRTGQSNRSNAYHRLAEMQGIVANNGSLPYKSGSVDIMKSHMALISTIDSVSGSLKPLARKHPMGTPIHLAKQQDIDKHRTNKEQYVNIGNFIQEGEPLFSVQNKHFGNYNQGGYGEANHYLIAGQNGSGKSTLAMQIVAGMLAANPQMGCLIPDTAGDFTNVGAHHRGSYQFDYLDLLTDAGRSPVVIGIDDIAMSAKRPYIELLTDVIRGSVSAAVDKATSMAEFIADSFGRTINGQQATFEAMFAALGQAIDASYQSKATRLDKQAAYQRLIDTPASLERFRFRYENQVLQFFTGSQSLEAIVQSVLDRGQIALLQLHTLGEREQSIVMSQLFRDLSKTASMNYKMRGANGMSNALVVLDEGPRWVPQGSDNETSNTIKDSFNTTRKYGLGWMIVTQRLTGIDNNVIAQCHSKFVGKGMGIGSDINHIKSLFGESGWVDYQALAHSGRFYWIATGNAINFGSGSQYVAFETFGGNVNEAMTEANKHIW